MPTVIYMGPHKAGRNMGRLGFWTWGEEVVKTQEWVNHYAKGLVGEFLVDGESFSLPSAITKEDEGDDGIPDMKWTKGDIMTWMDDSGVEYGALNTKAKLLAKVDAHLNPPEEKTEDSMSEGDMDNTTGDEE